MANITEEEFKKAADIIGCEVEAIKAVAKVESNGSGYLSDGSPKTLFEGHWFHKLTNGKYTGVEEYKAISYKKWTTKWYGGPKTEKIRLDLAISLDRNAALQSASWGAFQIMGFNYGICGFSKVQDFVNAMYDSEGAQLLAVIEFIKSKRIGGYLKDKKWADFAYYYNGKEYAVNEYDKKLKAAYDDFKKKSKVITNYGVIFIPNLFKNLWRWMIK